jgi:hypothetical protein
MKQILKSDKWIGYAALACAALVAITQKIVLVSGFVHVVHVMFIVCFGVFGLYCGVRGIFVGGRLSRICAGFSMLFWAWLIYTIIVVLMPVKMV